MPRSTGVKALIKIDGGQTYAPAITTFTNFGTQIPTPSVRTGLLNDLYLTLEPSVQVRRAPRRPSRSTSSRSSCGCGSAG